MKVVLVLGVKGVGKSSVIENAIDENWEVINFGDIMVDILKEKGIKRDEMSWKLNSEEYRKVQEEAGRILIERVKGSEKNIIIDSHAIIKNIFGYLPGFPEKILRELPLDGIVVITARPEEIFMRILRDKKEKGRERKEESISEIKEEQEFEVRMAMIYSFFKGIPFEIIENPEGRISVAIRKFKEFLEVI